MPEDKLTKKIEQIASSAGATDVALAFHDYAAGTSFDYQGDRWFHAASTIKVPVLLGVFAAIEEGDIPLDSRLHVRNRFFSVADGSPYRVAASRDAGSQVQAYVGRTMKIRELAKQMIVTSSNLATNLLVDLIGIDTLEQALENFGSEGIELKRGVEDEVAYERGINNRVTAIGLVKVLRAIEEASVSRQSSKEMLEILHAQEFRSGIPAGVPESARVANKTGEISTVAHDAGLVYLKDREPYALAILTQWDPSNTSKRRETLADLSRAVFEHLTESRADA